MRPGEGLFITGVISPAAADRLVVTMRRFGSLCRRYRARIRAVATSAVREAKNREEVVRRVREEAGINLEVVSGKEEARLICLGVLRGKPPLARSICVDIGGGSTEIAFAVGDQARDLWSVGLGSVRVSEMFATDEKLSRKTLETMREFSGEALRKVLPGRISNAPSSALGSSGTIQAVIAFAAPGAAGKATAGQISDAVVELAGLSLEKRQRRFDARRADIIVAGAVVLEAVMRHLRLDAITAVDAGLREGMLYDLVGRRNANPEDHSLADAASQVGRRFGWEEAHARQVTLIALTLFDDLAGLHGLPASARRYLEVAALLHDIGSSVSYQKHHKHTQYLIQNSDIAGLTDRERELVGCIARFHRRSAPLATHPAMVGLSLAETRLVRKCATLLRVADSLDSSHHQPIAKLTATDKFRSVLVRLRTHASVDLELWDAEHEIELFRQVFSRRLQFQVERAR